MEQLASFQPEIERKMQSFSEQNSSLLEGSLTWFQFSIPIHKMNSYLNISAEKLFYLLSIEVGDI